jgi:hypothetical protein
MGEERLRLMTKFYALTAFLQHQLSNEVTLTFKDLEDANKVGIALPGSARMYRHWWENASKPDARHCTAWLDAGWHVTAVDLAAEHVTFGRQAPRT